MERATKGAGHQGSGPPREWAAKGAGNARMFWTRASADLAAVCYVVAVGLWLVARPEQVRPRVRPWWTAGLVVLIVHIVIAYGLVHGWSHTAAVKETITRTQRLTGLEAPMGIYFNFACALLWSGDVLWWWLAPVSYERRGEHGAGRSFTWGLQAFLAFMMFNAAVVFVEGAARWGFGLATLGLVALAILRIQRGRQRS